MGDERQRARHAAMMKRGVGRKVVIVSDDKRCPGEVRIARWDSGDRTARALKTLGALWGLALLSLPVPALHLVLVPGFLVAGPIAAYVVSRQKSGVLGGEGTCPACGERFVIERTRDAWPICQVCLACRAHAVIEQAP